VLECRRTVSCTRGFPVVRGSDVYCAIPSALKSSVGYAPVANGSALRLVTCVSQRLPPGASLASASVRTPGLRRFARRPSMTAAAQDEEVLGEAKDVSAFQAESTFIKTMTERGFLHSCTNIEELDKQMKSGTVTAYLGFDATASSLHVGSLLQIMILRHLQKSGHKPIVLLGGGTTKVGDPTGKDASRKMLTDEEIGDNINGIKKAFDRWHGLRAAKAGRASENNERGRCRKEGG
jgi:hypothetical protein